MIIILVDRSCLNFTKKYTLQSVWEYVLHGVLEKNVIAGILKRPADAG